MLPLLYLAGVAIVATVVIAAFWKQISAWLGRVYEKLPPSVKENLKGALAFIEKIGATFKNLMVYYSYNENTEKWTETSVSREVDPSTIPSHILKKAQLTSKVDFTDDLTKELQLAYGH